MPRPGSDVPRPAAVAPITVAAPARPSPTGDLCGIPGIVGARRDPIRGAIAGCWVLNPVRVTAVHGVQLSVPATLDCPTARALSDWVANGVIPAIGNRGGGVAVLQVAGSYTCRTRNNRPGAGLSEHASGRAIDISAFRTADGQSISVAGGWRAGRDRQILRKIHATACGPFSTVLGPNADRFHQDHFHLDTAIHRSSRYCR